MSLDPTAALRLYDGAWTIPDYESRLVSLRTFCGRRAVLGSGRAARFFSWRRLKRGRPSPAPAMRSPLTVKSVEGL
jgi:hypothetical protein